MCGAATEAVLTFFVFNIMSGAYVGEPRLHSDKHALPFLVTRVKCVSDSTFSLRSILRHHMREDKGGTGLVDGIEHIWAGPQVKRLSNCLILVRRIQGSHVTL